MFQMATWQRVREGLARLRPRRLLRLVVWTGAVGLLAIGCEAVVRAHLDTPAARVPTMLYARPVPWGAEEPTDEPVPIGLLDGAPAEDRLPVALSQVPDALVAAVLAVEDQRFFDHVGIDLRRVGGAAIANLRAGRVTQGGSTLTQQLAKNLYLSARRSPLRKLREAAMALALELRYDKERILEAYLNEVYLGQDGALAIRGVGRAARYYFGKDVSRLSLPEAALLAGMIRGPNLYSPVRNPAAARERRDLVLRLMAEQGRTTQGAAERAARTPLRVRPQPRHDPGGRYFRDFAASRLGEEYGHDLPARGAFVYTTLDADLQRAAERAVRDGLAGIRASGVQAALVALDPRTGEVLAMVGGRNYGASQFNRATDARRQPGSAFKPVVALAALARRGSEAPAFTLASELEDEPLSVQTPAGPWEPSNYDNGFRGPVTLREALEQSLNVPFARLGLAVGPERIVATGKALGIRSRLHAVPALALGASEVTPLELTRAYGVLAAGGYRAETRAILSVTDAHGTVRQTAARRGAQVFDAAEAYLVTSALEGAVERGTGRGLRAQGYWGPVAGKSGTSSDWRDGWFVAYTPSLVVGVWVGYDDGRSMGLTGARSALPVVARFLRDALGANGGEEFPVPDGVEFASVGSRSFWGAFWGGCSGEPEVFLEGTAPRGRCQPSWDTGRWTVLLGENADEVAERLQHEAERVAELLSDRSDDLARLAGARARELRRAAREQGLQRLR